MIPWLANAFGASQSQSLASHGFNFDEPIENQNAIRYQQLNRGLKQVPPG
jgi:hypothetical protein